MIKRRLYRVVDEAPLPLPPPVHVDVLGGVLDGRPPDAPPLCGRCHGPKLWVPPANAYTVCPACYPQSFAGVTT